MAPPRISEFIFLRFGFPSAVLLIYSFFFAPYWIRHRGNEYGPMYGRKQSVFGGADNVYLPEYHMDVYHGMAAVFVFGMALLISAAVQVGYSFLPHEHLRHIITIGIASWIALMHLMIVLTTAVASGADWIYYIVAILGSAVVTGNLVVSVLVYKQ